MMAKESIEARVLPLRSFLFLLPKNFNIHLKCTIVKELTRREYMLYEYSQSAILHAPHFR